MSFRSLSGVCLFTLCAIAAACGDDEAATPPAGGTSSGGTSGNNGTSGGDGTSGGNGTSGGGTSGGPTDPGTHTDGKLSPDIGETDIDCGGATAPKCVESKTCKVDTDCATGTCSATKKCISAPSCKGTNGAAGIDTCGTGEPGAQGAVTESCCKSLPLPKTAKRTLDRYEITAGRIREFVTAIAAANAGEPNIRKFAKDFATANPQSQLGKVQTGFTNLLNVLPDRKATDAPVPLQVHLGAFPIDPMNAQDGCFMKNGDFGHATYWQTPDELKAFGVSAPDGKRKYERDVLDAKAMNCVMPLMLAAFCAWDGGELARTSDYHEVWGRTNAQVGNATIFVPWTAILRVGEFNWRNGHGGNCINGWPGCTDAPTQFYAFPTAGNVPANDDTPAIGAPGRFPKDITKITSANGEGWFDIGGNMMEAAWPNGTVNLGPNPITNVCDVTSTGTGTACTRQGQNGTRRYAGALPHVALVGYSFEGHARRSEEYLSSVAGNENELAPADLKPATFQYGKVGGRCARVIP